MKKLMTFFLTTAYIACLTGCNKMEAESTDDPTSTNVISSVTSDSTQANDNVDPTSESKSGLSDEEKKLISELKQQGFVGPDGETVYAEDADYVFDTRTEHTEAGSPGFKFNEAMYSETVGYGESGEPLEPEMINTVLRYDFAYIRYCRPLFYMGEMLEDDAEQQMIDDLPEDKWFKVKAGDKLDCGLTVKKAMYEHFPVVFGNATRDNYVEYDGDIMLDGLLYTVKNDRDYLVKTGDLTFTPDPTKTNGIPDCTHDLNSDAVIKRSMYNDSSTYVLADVGAPWIVGTVDDIDRNYIFGDDEVVRVKVTLTNIRYGGILSCDMPAFYADLVEIERAD